MTRRRLCATCGESFSYSAKACPKCAAAVEALKPESRASGKHPCSTPGCLRLGTILTDKWRCGPCLDAHRFGTGDSDGQGYRAFKARLEEMRAMK